MGQMIDKIGPGTHAASGVEILVFWRHGENRGDFLVMRRSWLTGCTLMACSGWVQLGPRTVLAAAMPGQPADGQSATHFLPLFPLGIVVFPGELVLLHIFESRYKQLIAESAETHINFGIVTIVPGGASSIGTKMKLERILKTDESGEMDVAVRGLRAFRLKSFQREIEGKLYSGGLVSFDQNDTRIEPKSQSALVQLYNRRNYPSGSRQKLVAPYPDNLSFLIGHDVGFSQAQELQLLTMPVEYDRQLYLLQHLLRTQ